MAIVSNMGTFIMQLAWEKNDAEVSLVNYADEIRIWRGKVLKEAINKFAADLQLTVAVYKSQLEEILKRRSYQMELSENPSDTIDLIIKSKKYRDDVILAVSLEKLEFTTTWFHNFMVPIAKLLREQHSKMDSLRAEEEQLKRDRAMLEERCAKYERIVQDLEPSLYQRFSEAFNEQKKKILGVVFDKSAEEEKEKK